jgi:hypothetical protein
MLTTRMVVVNATTTGQVMTVDTGLELAMISVITVAADLPLRIVKTVYLTRIVREISVPVMMATVEKDAQYISENAMIDVMAVMDLA